MIFIKFKEIQFFGDVFITCIQTKNRIFQDTATLFRVKIMFTAPMVDKQNFTLEFAIYPNNV